MHITPAIAFGFALVAFAFTRMRTQRLTPWQMLIGLVAVLAALLIVMNPEFLALGILGDSVFFDLLVLAISFQLQTMGSRVWGWVVAAFSIVKRFVFWRIYSNKLALASIYSMVLYIAADIASTVQKVLHRLSS